MYKGLVVCTYRDHDEVSCFVGGHSGGVQLVSLGYECHAHDCFDYYWEHVSHSHMQF